MDIEQKIAIIIPCYNEGKRLDINKFISYANENKNVSFFFVDDGSLDNTRIIIQNMSIKSHQIQTVCLDKNCGKGEAVRQGFIAAQHLKFSYIGFWDADLSTPLSNINLFYKEIVEHQVFLVTGARVRLLGRDIQRKLARHYAGRLFATFASITLNLGIYDTQCGAKLFRNNDMLAKVVSVPFCVGWVFDVEMLARYKILSKSEKLILENLIIEYPLEKWIHKSGSKVKPSDFIKATIELSKIYLFLKVPYYKARYEESFKQ